MHRTRTLAPTPTLNRQRLERAATLNRQRLERAATRNRQPWERAAGLAALAATLFTPAPAARAQTVTVTALTPAHFESSSGSAISGNAQVGSGYFTPEDGGTSIHALLWTGTAASAVDLHPTGFGPYPTPFDYSLAYGVSGNTQAGVFYSDYGTHYAVLWHGTADSIVSLDNDYTSDNTGSAAVAASGDAQVGYVSEQFNDDEPIDYTAALWHGTADSVVGLGAYGFRNTIATGVSGNTQVGYGFNYDDGSFVNALLWHGTSDSAVDLNPSEDDASYAYGTSGDTQVGTVFLGDDSQHAALWHGTAASFVDLRPTGKYRSVATGAADGAQVGYAVVSRKSGSEFSHALLWRGTAASVLDLNTFLPNGQGSSAASGVSGSGGVYDVVGTANGAAVVWHVVFAPTVQHLDPASRTAGREAFTLSVIGKDFTSSSKVQWNGTAQATTFVNSTTLTASIPASLIAQAGTAQVTVNTPGGGTSGSHAETVMPRPTLSALSPASKRAGSGAFTLTVTGTGFRSASFYAPSVVKWNGMELATTYVSPTKLTALIPATLTAHSGTAQVTVTTPQVATSAGKTFTLTP